MPMKQPANNIHENNECLEFNIEPISMDAFLIVTVHVSNAFYPSVNLNTDYPVKDAGSKIIRGYYH